MLTLVKDKSAQELVGIYSNETRSKRPEATVYFTHDMRPEKENVAPCAGVLALHKNSLKKINKISQTSFDRICTMIDSGAEPEVGEQLRSEFWEIKKEYERALRREMYLGDQSKVRFELNLPRSKDVWGGTFTCVGNSGAGKTRWVVEFCLRYLRATKPHARRTIIWISPEWEIDKSVQPLKDPRYNFNVIGIDVSEQAVKKSGMGGAAYYSEKVEKILEDRGDHAVVVLDDFMDAAQSLVPFLRTAYNTMLRTARHRVTSVISLVHSYASGKYTSQALQSNKFLVFFPRSQQNRLIMFLRDHMMMSVPEAKELVQRFAKLDRYLVIQMHSPVALFNSKYLLLV